MDQKDLSRLFDSPDAAHRPIYYFTLPPLAPGFEAALTGEIERCVDCGASALIPALPTDDALSDAALDVLRGMYALLLAEAKKKDLTVGFFLDAAIERTILKRDASGTMRAKLLDMKEYICMKGEVVSKKLHSKDPLSLVAFFEERGEVIDLRPFIKEGAFTFKIPDGNYVIREYFLAEDTARDAVDPLSYDASLSYLHAAFSLFADIFEPYLHTTLTMLSFAKIGFGGQNHRTWSEHFDAAFRARFNLDPSPLYPALFDWIGEKTPHVKAYFTATRAELLERGMLQALSDFAREKGLSLFGTLEKPKLTAPSAVSGDPLFASRFAPTALFDRAYMYGTNSTVIASSAAYNFDIETVNGELFRRYPHHDRPLPYYKDTTNALVRGVNRIAFHKSPALTKDRSFADFVARVQTLLRGGRHVADIAVLYPIYHLHSRLNLYFSPVSGEEYPPTPPTADYMTLINSITVYSGHDVTLLHPETLNARCHTAGGVLYLDNEKNAESFRVVVLPATTMIDLNNLRLLKRFYDEGGKIIATGVLPTMAFQYDEEGKNDAEVKNIVEEIFGKEALDHSIMRDFCHNKNARGGESFFLYFNASASDGTHMTRSSTVNAAINSLGITFDIYIPNMPRLECTGALNMIYPDFHGTGLDRSFPGGGMFDYIHKKHADCDVYYFSNTTFEGYDHHVLLRGAFDISEWDPHTGAKTPRKSKILSFAGVPYTRVRLTLGSFSSTLFIATPAAPQAEPMEAIDSIGNLQSEHAKRMSEF